MSKLHTYYLDELRPVSKSITLTEVIYHINTLHPAQQMFALNYHMRKQTSEHTRVEFMDQQIAQEEKDME